MAPDSDRRPGGVAAAVTVAAMVAAALAVMWVGNQVSAFTPDGRTRCGPALQEWRALFDEVSGRCHEARRDRLWLGIQVAAAMSVAAAVVLAAAGPRVRRRRPPG